MGKLKWQDVAKILMVIGLSTGLITYSDLLGTLFQLKGINYVHSGDVPCGTICESYINVTTTYWRVCFAHYNGTKYEDEIMFKKVSRSRTLHINLDMITNVVTTEPDIPVDWLVPARGIGNWRPLQSGDCWDRGKVNKIKLVGYKKPFQTVKWTLKTGNYLEIDPLWTGGNVTIIDPVSNSSWARNSTYNFKVETCCFGVACDGINLTLYYNETYGCGGFPGVADFNTNTSCVIVEASWSETYKLNDSVIVPIVLTENLSFYTINQNPYGVNLTANECINYTWNVNVSELEDGRNYDLFVVTNLSADMTTFKFSDIININSSAFGSDLTFPSIEFIKPTPDDSDSSTNTSVQINVSIIETNITNIVYNWNKSNFTVYNASLVLMHNFDSISALGENATVVRDLSLSNVTVTVVGATLNITDCVYGNCYEFDGINDYIKSSLRLSLIDGTLSLWAKRGIDTVTSYIFYNYKSSGGNNRFYVIENNGVLQTTLGLEGATKIIRNLDNEWFHISVTYNLTQYNVYINGLLNATFTKNAWNNNDVNCYFGATENPTSYFNGSIDEIRMWNITLTAQQVQQQYFQNLNKFNTTHWNLYINQSLNTTDALTVGSYTYQAFTDNVLDQHNRTEQRTITVNALDTCTYSSGAWAVDCSDDCIITSNVDVSSNNISIIGTGTFTTQVNITGFDELLIQGTDSSNICEVTCEHGGCFG